MAAGIRWDFLEYQVAGRSQYVKNKSLRQFIKPILNLQGGERILDVGCGIGAFGKLIQPLLGPNSELIGIDTDSVQVDYGNHHWAKQPIMRLEVGDATCIQYPDASFDLVAAMGLLEFVNSTAALSEMRRVLSSPGKIVVIQIDTAHYEQRPRDDQFESFWGAYLGRMRALGVDLDLTRFRACCKEHEWVLEEFTLNVEYRVRITKPFLTMVEKARVSQMQSESYMRQVFEFNYQFVKHAGWSAERLHDFFECQYRPETFLHFLQSHFGEDYYQKTPLHVYRIPFQ